MESGGAGAWEFLALQNLEGPVGFPVFQCVASVTPPVSLVKGRKNKHMRKMFLSGWSFKRAGNSVEKARSSSEQQCTLRSLPQQQGPDWRTLSVNRV